MAVIKNKGRKKGSGLIADPFCVADFKGFKVVAHQQSTRFVIQWDWISANDGNPGFTAFEKALKRLEESTHYRPLRADGSLIGDLSIDWEPAHIFVALNLHQLEKYAAGELAHFHDPVFCCWLAMEQSWRHAIHDGGRG